jgi:serine/threonine protein kinase
VKPENVLLCGNGEPRLTDFGVCAAVSDTVEMSRKVGTPPYVPPEVWIGRQYSIKVDSFSAGALLYYMVTGRVLFNGHNIKSIASKALKLQVDFTKHSTLRRLTSDCKELIERLLQKDPQWRITASNALQHAWMISLSEAMQLAKTNGSVPSLLPNVDNSSHTPAPSVKATSPGPLPVKEVDARGKASPLSRRKTTDSVIDGHHDTPVCYPEPVTPDNMRSAGASDAKVLDATQCKASTPPETSSLHQGSFAPEDNAKVLTAGGSAASLQDLQLPKSTLSSPERSPEGSPKAIRSPMWSLEPHGNPVRSADKSNFSSEATSSIGSCGSSESCDLDVSYGELGEAMPPEAREAMTPVDELDEQLLGETTATSEAATARPPQAPRRGPVFRYARLLLANGRVR